MKKYKPFQFRQFSVRQERAAMKVGTDAILLGSWAGQNAANVTSILDIGTGTGIVALMMAQRFPNASITAIDIDSGAVDEAAENFRDSPWSDRCTAIMCPAQEFDDGPFDLIVSNPPWFHEEVKPQTQARQLARHDDSLSVTELINAVAELLSPTGHFATILPPEHAEEAVACAARHGLFGRYRTDVSPTPGKPTKRVLLEFCRERSNSCQTTEIAVELKRHEYTREYAMLTKDFLLRSRKFI